MNNIDKKLIITAGVIIIENNKVLLVKRPSDTKAFPNAWTFPGGKLENNENLEECAIRECKEEVGIVPTNMEKYSFYEFDMKKSKTISHIYTGQINGDIRENENVKRFSVNDIGNTEIAFGYETLIKELLS